MDHKANASEATTNRELKTLTLVDNGAATLGEKAAAELVNLKASLTPAQYREIFKTTAECAAMAAFPAIGITWAAEQVAAKIMKHK
jgi:hypothetical protein